MGFSREEYWSGLPFPSLGDLPDSGIEPRSLVLWEDSLPSEPPQKSQDQRKWVKVLQSCPTLCDSMDYAIHGILQARILKWAAFAFSRGSSQPRDWTRSPTLQADSLPAKPPREAQEYWSGKPIPSPANLPDPGIELGSLLLCMQVDSLPTELWGKPPGSDKWEFNMVQLAEPFCFIKYPQSSANHF